MVVVVAHGQHFELWVSLESPKGFAVESPRKEYIYVRLTMH